MQPGRIAGNAFWNLVSIGSGALLAVALPPFLTRMLPVETFGAWALVLQVASYVNLLGFGMQTIVARHVAISAAEPDRARRDAIVSTAFWALLVAAGCALLLLLLAASQLDALFPTLPAALAGEVAAAIMLVGAAVALTLPAAVLSGVFVGLQHNHVPALALTAMRMVIFVAVVLAANRTASLGGMGSAYLLATCAGVCLQFLLWWRMTPEPSLAPQMISRAAGRQLADEGLGLTVWNLSMLLVAGLDLIIVARVDYPMVPYFAVAAALAAFLGGVMQATSAAILPVAARLTVRGDAAALNTLVALATRINGSLGLIAAAPLVLAGGFILSIWVGFDYARQSNVVLAVLVVAGSLRTLALPYVAGAVSAGLQGRMIVTPLVEGIVNVVASILLGMRYGAIGVALGTLIGALVGQLALLAQHPLRDAMGGAGVRQYAIEALWPLARLLGVLVVIWILLPEQLRFSPWTGAVSLVCAVVLCALTVLVGADRQLLRSAAVARVGRSAGRGDRD